ncbi:hypothetical protein VTO73DRAFT_7949 [Trametes versicolor]
MSIVTHNRAIVPTVWPGGLGRPDTSRFDLQVKDNWQYVPETFEGVCDWAAIGQEDDEGGHQQWGRRDLVYAARMLPEASRGTLFTVTLVLQGFLGRFNVSVLGNWTKRDMAPSSAVQFLTLQSGGAREAFGAQVRAMKDVHQFICAKAGASFGSDGISEDSIRLERAVFTKVRAHGEQPPSIRLNSFNDPGARARKVAAQWRVDHVVNTRARRSGGHEMDVSASSLLCGDFVEVSAFADIQVVRRNGRMGTVIRFAMMDVVKLWSAEDAKHQYQRTDVDIRMAPVTSHFYLFAHNPRTSAGRNRRIWEGYPEEGGEVQFTHANCSAILGVANTVSRLGIAALFPVLPELIAPDNGGIYNNRLADDDMNPPALFIWEALDVSGRLAHHSATHAVHFAIFSQAPRCAVHLSMLVLRLIDEGTKASIKEDDPEAIPRRFAKLKGLTYAIRPSGVYGTAFLSGVKYTYARAEAYAKEHPQYTFAPSVDSVGFPITTWPEGCEAHADPDVVLDCYETVSSLGRV